MSLRRRKIKDQNLFISMLLSDFDYHLPQELIAQEPIKPRDHARLLILHQDNQPLEHLHFFDLPKFLKAGDVLVFNDTKVFKARLLGTITNKEAAAEIFLLRPLDENNWEVLLKPGKKLQIGSQVNFEENLECIIVAKPVDGPAVAKFNKTKNDVLQIAEKIGHVPIPPYIKTEPQDASDYQTVYAKEIGSVAAPTAGFHFTPEILEKIEKMGIQVEFVTLHVGLGTFLPVKTEKVEDHKMHSEWVEVSTATASAINQAKKENRRVIAVGTTTARTLEGVVQALGELKQFSGDINIFITPGFKFKIIDGLITNFHLPKSTLLMLVSALSGREKILAAYEETVKKEYKFFSFGDAMLIL
ncbi:MAG: S-adenosylmethionine:tRNA ribosyltransferase-isomerase [Candidatus Magasanikbacteria bacterium GW2011_GWC2_40_17]|uniref:S-adenosylmethionine:tRNA ribosyltransferase-isomerase n=1 Tax=Candidatus Magasanikbacteria bacterium GW2011_GWA2_42_32 TaxID=1619039 RepID=A0A0G1D392_9BACT|nr:MAG: S-adenosylmethionine:tRNA ribosyltransferase-isomerase [Candidatus Magasanikbacteria bacterium GW2011_GWC2_40_17]KKS56473.1 MAG: S-adenosylmethionine:tRNA ribosyltransferase-isomerase [Candidatus Magasanikbacteria bacterium GW2011_GWA2_42_32]